MSEERPIVKFTVNAAFFREIKDDHKQLQQLLEQLRVIFKNRPALENHRRELHKLLSDLRDQLALHFTLEEAYGYFEDAIERAPRFHAQAGRLRDQHTELYVMAQNLVEKTNGHFDTEDVADQFAAFDTALKSHESAELKLILDAIQQDVGEGD